MPRHRFRPRLHGGTRVILIANIRTSLHDGRGAPHHRTFGLEKTQTQTNLDPLADYFLNLCTIEIDAAPLPVLICAKVALKPHLMRTCWQAKPLTRMS